MNKRIGLLCAGGDFPRAVAMAAKENGYKPFLLLFEGLADPSLSKAFDSSFVSIAHFGKILALLRANDCAELVSVGSLVRPRILGLMPDFKGLTTLPALLKAYMGGDNHLLTSVANAFEREGFIYRGVHEIAPQLLMSCGVMTSLKPTQAQNTDITLGLRALAAMGEFDIGQALILHNGHIVAVEGAEGTDGLLLRMKNMRENGRVRWASPQGILVKALKPNQDLRLDMPAIGVNTLKGIAAAGLQGLAVQAGATLMLEGQKMIETADKNKIFICGV